MARLRPTEPAPAAARPQWLSQFRWQDWDESALPPDVTAQGFNAGTAADPLEAAWVRRVLAARHRWNAAREKWFWEHGEGEAHYRVRLTGETPQDIDEEEQSG